MAIVEGDLELFNTCSLETPKKNGKPMQNCMAKSSSPLKGRKSLQGGGSIFD